MKSVYLCELEKGVSMNAPSKIKNVLFIAVFLVAQLGCSGVQRKLASDESAPADENKALFKELQATAVNVNSDDVITAVEEGVEGVVNFSKGVRDSKITGLLAHTILSHSVELLDAVLKLHEGQSWENLSSDEKASSISVPVSIVITATAWRHLVNAKVSFLSKWRGGLVAAGKKARFIRVPTFFVPHGRPRCRALSHRCRFKCAHQTICHHGPRRCSESKDIIG